MYQGMARQPHERDFPHQSGFEMGMNPNAGRESALNKKQVHYCLNIKCHLPSIPGLDTRVSMHLESCTH